jgi:hypothetical protein
MSFPLSNSQMFQSTVAVEPCFLGWLHFPTASGRRQIEMYLLIFSKQLIISWGNVSPIWQKFTLWLLASGFSLWIQFLASVSGFWLWLLASEVIF